MHSDDAPRFNLTIGCVPVKFIWFRVAKCGTRSTLKLLRQHVTEFQIEQGFNRRYPRKELLDYKKFSVVRNPYTRIVSGWNDKIRLDNRGGLFVTEGQKKKLQDFDYFVEWLVDQPKRTANIHLRPQSLLVPHDVHEIGHVENLDRDLCHILKRAGFPNIKEVPHINAKWAPKETYQFNARILKLLNDYFESDFERFGYKMQT
jgi:hypothetical protein